MKNEKIISGIRTILQTYLSTVHNKDESLAISCQSLLSSINKLYFSELVNKIQDLLAQAPAQEELEMLQQRVVDLIGVQHSAIKDSGLNYFYMADSLEYHCILKILKLFRPAINTFELVHIFYPDVMQIIHFDVSITPIAHQSQQLSERVTLACHTEPFRPQDTETYALSDFIVDGDTVLCLPHVTTSVSRLKNQIYNVLKDGFPQHLDKLNLWHELFNFIKRQQSSILYYSQTMAECLNKFIEVLLQNGSQVTSNHSTLTPSQFRAVFAALQKVEAYIKCYPPNQQEAIWNMSSSVGSNTTQKLSNVFWDLKNEEERCIEQVAECIRTIIEAPHNAPLLLQRLMPQFKYSVIQNIPDRFVLPVLSKIKFQGALELAGVLMQLREPVQYQVCLLNNQHNQRFLAHESERNEIFSCLDERGQILALEVLKENLANTIVSAKSYIDFVNNLSLKALKFFIEVCPETFTHCMHCHSDLFSGRIGSIEKQVMISSRYTSYILSLRQNRTYTEYFKLFASRIRQVLFEECKDEIIKELVCAEKFNAISNGLTRAQRNYILDALSQSYINSTQESGSPCLYFKNLTREEREFQFDNHLDDIVQHIQTPEQFIQTCDILESHQIMKLSERLDHLVDVLLPTFDYYEEIMAQLCKEDEKEDCANFIVSRKAHILTTVASYYDCVRVYRVLNFFNILNRKEKKEFFTIFKDRYTTWQPSKYFYRFLTLLTIKERNEVINFVKDENGFLEGSLEIADAKKFSYRRDEEKIKNFNTYLSYFKHDQRLFLIEKYQQLIKGFYESYDPSFLQDNLHYLLKGLSRTECEAICGILNKVLAECIGDKQVYMRLMERSEKHYRHIIFNIKFKQILDRYFYGSERDNVVVSYFLSGLNNYEMRQVYLKIQNINPPIKNINLYKIITMSLSRDIDSEKRMQLIKNFHTFIFKWSKSEIYYFFIQLTPYEIDFICRRYSKKLPDLTLCDFSEMLNTYKLYHPNWHSDPIFLKIAAAFYFGFKEKFIAHIVDDELTLDFGRALKHLPLDLCADLCAELEWVGYWHTFFSCKVDFVPTAEIAPHAFYLRTLTLIHCIFDKAVEDKFGVIYDFTKKHLPNFIDTNQLSINLAIKKFLMDFFVCYNALGQAKKTIYRKNRWNQEAMLTEVENNNFLPIERLVEHCYHREVNPEKSRTIQSFQLLIQYHGYRQSESKQDKYDLSAFIALYGHKHSIPTGYTKFNGRTFFSTSKLAEALSNTDDIDEQASGQRINQAFRIA